MSNSARLVQITRVALEKSNMKPSRKLGQNYVVDQNLLDCMLGAACLDGSETVLEIGAGIGTLTRELASKAGRVIAIEKDGRAADFLVRELGCSNVDVIRGDILEMDLPKADKVVSNLPYSISTPVTFKLLSEGDFELAVLTYQKEVAERLVAEPGGSEYSRLTVAAALRAEIRIQGIYPPDSFYPPPGVESAVVSLKRRKRADMVDEDWIWLDDTLKALFSQRKRTLRKALDTYSKLKRLAPGVASANVNGGLLGKRVFELEPSDFLCLSRNLRSAQGNSLSSSDQEYGGGAN